MLCRKCNAAIPDGSAFCCICGASQNPPRKSYRRPNGTGTVYRLQGRRKRPWAAVKNKVVLGYYESKTAAVEALGHYAASNVVERFNMTFKEVYEGWSAEHFKTVGQSAVKLYSGAFKAYAPLHDIKFRNLRTQDFQRVIDAHSDKSRSYLTILKELALLMSRWAMREEIATTNFAVFITLPDKPKKEKEIFSDDEIRKLIADNSETSKIILMLLCTGMRIGELFSLPLKDYYGTYCIGGEKTSAGKNRVIPIPPEGRKYFEYFARQATGDLLLSGYVGGCDVAVFRARYYYPLLKKLGIKRKTPHSTRHTYISHAVKEGIKPEILQRIVGHSNYSTTADVYTHVNKNTLIEAVESVSSLLVTENVESRLQPRNQN